MAALCFALLACAQLHPAVAILDEMLNIDLESLEALTDMPSPVLACQSKSYILDGSRLLTISTSDDIKLTSIRNLDQLNGPGNMQGGACFGEDLLVFEE